MHKFLESIIPETYVPIGILYMYYTRTYTLIELYTT